MIAGSANAAPAELALGDIQLELEPRHDFFADGEDGTIVSTDPYYRFAGFAQLTGGGHGGGDFGVGAAGAIAGLGCDFLSGQRAGPTAFRFDVRRRSELLVLSVARAADDRVRRPARHRDLHHGDNHSLHSRVGLRVIAETANRRHHSANDAGAKVRVHEGTGRR